MAEETLADRIKSAVAEGRKMAESVRQANAEAEAKSKAAERKKEVDQCLMGLAQSVRDAILDKGKVVIATDVTEEIAYLMEKEIRDAGFTPAVTKKTVCTVHLTLQPEA